jgi:hypothetical protein
MDWKTLLGLGAQVSGFQNPEWGAVILVLAALSGVVSLIVAFYKGVQWIRHNLSNANALLSVAAASARRNVIPIMIGAAVVASLTLLGVTVAFAVM